MLWAWKRGLWTLAEAWRLARPFFPWLLLLVILQIVADWRSARFFLPEGAPMWRSIATSLIKLGAQLPFILFFILLCRVLLREEASRRAMLQGAVWSFGFLAFWCTVQAAYYIRWRHLFIRSRRAEARQFWLCGSYFALYLKMSLLG